LINALRAAKPKRLPTILTKQQARQVIGHLSGLHLASIIRHSLFFSSRAKERAHMISSHLDSAGMSVSRLARIEPMIQRHIDQGWLAGVHAVVSRRGKVVYDACQGFMDIESSRALAADALYRLYSMTKPITAAAALILLEEGAYQLDDPIARWIPCFGRAQVVDDESAENPELSPVVTAITVRHLMTHTSGIVYPGRTKSAIDRAWHGPDLNGKDLTLEELAGALARIPLAFQPGTRWRYGLSIDLLGRLIEIWSGVTLDVFLRDHVFEPLGMVDTGFAVPADRMDRLAVCYTHDPKGSPGRLLISKNAYDGAPKRNLSGGGGLYGTAQDYWRFAQMLCNGGELDGVRVLGRKAIELMTMNHLGPELMPFIPDSWPYSRGVGMGLGVRMTIDVAASQMPGSVGSFTWQGAASTDFWVDPQENMVGVWMTQHLPGRYEGTRDFRNLVYAAIED